MFSFKHPSKVSVLRNLLYERLLNALLFFLQFTNYTVLQDQVCSRVIYWSIGKE